MGGLPSTVTNESIFRIPVTAKISCHDPEKDMAEAVTHDMASSDWLKFATLCLFRAQSVSKNKSICDCAGAPRPQGDRSTLVSNSLLSQGSTCSQNPVPKEFPFTDACDDD